MASSSFGRDLRTILGHRSAAKAKRSGQVINIEEDPVSPPGILVLDEEAMAAAAAQGRRRSSLVLAAEESPRALDGGDDEEEGGEEGESTMASLVSQGSCASLPEPCCLPGEPALPSFLQEEKEQQEQVGRDEAKTSESPSPSQRAALVALYDAEGAATAALQGSPPGSTGEADTEEVEAAVHLLADRLVTDRPELKRWDSADAQLEMARRKQKKEGTEGRRVLNSGLRPSDEDDQGSSGGGPVLANALEHPPQTSSSAKRRGSGLVELAAEGVAQSEAGSEHEHEHGPLGSLRPLLAHFDSGDYFREKEERKARGSAVETIQPEQQGQQQDGHRAAASFILHQGHK